MKYKGYEIMPWSGPYQQGRREPHWYIQIHHIPTGIAWSAQECPQVWSLREAKEKINQIIRERNT